MTTLPPRERRLVVKLNACVAGLSGGVTLVLLLIAPLGLAAVLTITLLVIMLTFAAGVMADLVLCRRFQTGAGQGMELHASLGDAETSRQSALPGSSHDPVRKRSF